MTAPGRWDAAPGRALMAVAAAAVVLGSVVVPDSAVLRMMAFLVVCNLVLRLYYLTWPVLGPILVGPGDPGDDDGDDDDPGPIGDDPGPGAA